MEDNKISTPEGWRVSDDYAEMGPDSGKTKKNAELVRPGPQSGEDDYHSKYVDPNGKFGAAKVGGADDCYGGKGGEDQEKPEGSLPLVPQDWGLQAPRYPKKHSGVASSY